MPSRCTAGMAWSITSTGRRRMDSRSITGDVLGVADFEEPAARPIHVHAPTFRHGADCDEVRGRFNDLHETLLVRYGRFEGRRTLRHGLLERRLVRTSRLLAFPRHIGVLSDSSCDERRRNGRE